MHVFLRLGCCCHHRRCWRRCCVQVGRTARGRDGRGRALLMLMPEELGFLKYLKQAKVRAGCCTFLIQVGAQQLTRKEPVRRGHR